MKNYSLLKLEKKLGEPAENLPSGHSQFHSKMAFLPFLNAFGAAAVLLALALTFLYKKFNFAEKSGAIRKKCRFFSRF